MPGFVVRTLINALGLWIAASLLEGIFIQGTWNLLAAAILLGIVNAIVRPILVVLTFPITVVTLGLFLLVVNAGMVGLVARLLDGFDVDGFATALLCAVIVSVTSWFASWYIGPKGRVEVVVVRR